MENKISFRRIENGISVSFVNKRTGKREVAHARTGRALEQYFAKKCTKNHLPDLGYE